MPNPSWTNCLSLSPIPGNSCNAVFLNRRRAYYPWIGRYRSRDQIEVDFFVLAFMRSYAAEAGIKTTEKKIQESMGDMLLLPSIHVYPGFVYADVAGTLIPFGIYVESNFNCLHG